jgi:RNA polymerase sigma-70 factor (ECF subfamily)
MKMPEEFVAADAKGMTDELVVERVRAGDTALYEIIMRRYNQRLYRVASAILRDSAEAEDVMQDTYVRAYRYLHQFAGESSFSTWLTRIAVNESLRRLRLRKRISQLDDFDSDDESPIMNVVEMSPDPEQSASNSETTRILEQAIMDLPYQFRTVVMMRDVEQMSTLETAAALELSQENVKVRLHRGHALMRGWLFARLGENSNSAFGFMGHRCDHVVASVLSRIKQLSANEN